MATVEVGAPSGTDADARVEVGAPSGTDADARVEVGAPRGTHDVPAIPDGGLWLSVDGSWRPAEIWINVP